MASLIGLIIITTLLFLAISTAFAVYLGLEKGFSFKTGFWWGLLFPVGGIVVIAMKNATDIKIATEMYDRNLMDITELHKTQEFLLKRDQNIEIKMNHEINSK